MEPSSLPEPATQIHPRPRTDTPPALGITRTLGGTQVAVLARHAESVELCLINGEGERRIPLRHTAYGIWWDTVDNLPPGTRYGFRVHGPWQPEAGHRHNPDKFLLDPYGHAVDGWVRWGPEVYGHLVDEQLRSLDGGQSRDTRDSAPSMPRSVVVDQGYDWGEDTRPAVPWPDTIIYEAHVRGLTMRHPELPPQLRGTYAALGHPAIIDHLTGLGVTTLQLLPVHSYVSEPALALAHKNNYWGYNTLGFFAPHSGYAAAHDPQGVIDEVKGAVRALHTAGIEVVLDVVYNHTAEQGSGQGPTLSWRGLDNRTYYRLDEQGRDVDVTGCGNTLDLRDPQVARMVLDSLRHWAQVFHVDGFRFDLAPALARGRDDAYDRDHPFLVALQTDPVLSGLKLIVEPWDVGVHGWRTGQFPAPLAEWNDRYRDTVRSFWLEDAGRQLSGQPGHGIRDLATRLAGSADLFAEHQRRPLSSINFVTAHDGFTLADLTSYQVRRNWANGEENRDGHSDNRSWNHGVEGPSTDPPVLAARERSMRNLLATLLLSTGVPMLSAGDELGRTQLGNNNAYCQDNHLTWTDWQLTAWQRSLLADTTELVRLRRELRLLRSTHFPTFDPVAGRTRLRWYDEAGSALTAEQWADPCRRTVVAVYDTLHEQGSLPDEGPGMALALVLHAGPDPISVTLPEVSVTHAVTLPEGSVTVRDSGRTSKAGVPTWQLRWSSTEGSARQTEAEASSRHTGAEASSQQTEAEAGERHTGAGADTPSDRSSLDSPSITVGATSFTVLTLRDQELTLPDQELTLGDPN